MASQVIESLAVASAAVPTKAATQLTDNPGNGIGTNSTTEKSSVINVKEEGHHVSRSNKSPDPEDPSDGLFHQHIDRDGQQVLVTWAKDEERRVVRKADFLFLPLFAVCAHTHTYIYIPALPCVKR